jgi:hypothetical protein
VSEFKELLAFPSSVLGPMERRAFNPLAASLLGVNIKSPYFDDKG